MARFSHRRRPDMSPLERVLAVVRDRVTRDASLARSLARDLSVVATRGRTSFMNDYSPGVSAEDLVGILPDVCDALSTPRADVFAATMRGTTFVINARALDGEGRRRTFVCLDGNVPELAGGTRARATAEAWDRARLAMSLAVRSMGDERVVIDLDAVLEASGSALSPVTIAGILLDFPCVYAMEAESMTSAAAVLSSCALSVHSIECALGGDVCSVYGWSIPSSLQIDDERLSAWFDSASHALRTLGFRASHKVSHNASGSVKIVF